MLLSGVTWAPRFSNGSRVVLPPARSFTRAEIHRRESYHLAWQVAVNHTRPVLHCRSTSNSSRAGVPRLPRITYRSCHTTNIMRCHAFTAYRAIFYLLPVASCSVQATFLESLAEICWSDRIFVCISTPILGSLGTRSPLLLILGPAQLPNCRMSAFLTCIDYGRVHCNHKCSPGTLNSCHIRYLCSSDWTSIDIAELEKLLDSTYHRDNHDAQGSSRPQSADNDSSAESHGKRLQIAKLVSNSMLVIAAFVRSSSMPSFNASEEPGLSSDVEGDWKWVAEQRRHRRKRVLVGFVCVGGDRTLVSTLYNVVVHPELQGCGLGGKMILRACRNVFALGIGDVAVMAPNKLQGLFQERERSCLLTHDTAVFVPSSVVFISVADYLLNHAGMLVRSRSSV